MKTACHESQAPSCELKDQKAKVEKVVVKVPLLTSGGEKAADRWNRFSAEEVELAYTISALDAKRTTLKATVRECVKLNCYLRSAQAAVSQGKRVIHHFSERISTGYTSSMLAQAGDYRDCLNPFLTDALLQGEYIGGYHRRVGDDGNSLHMGDAHSHSEPWVAFLPRG